VEASERFNENLPTAGLLVIDIALEDWSRLHAHCGRLDRFISPRLLDLATD
jgi:phosphohistidine phosphatase